MLLIPQPADIMLPVLLAVKITLFKYSFLAYHFLEVSSREKKGLCFTWGTKKVSMKENFHYFVLYPIPVNQLLLSTWAFQKQCEQHFSRQRVIITDGINIANLSTIYLYHRSFPKSKITAEKRQEALYSANTQ